MEKEKKEFIWKKGILGLGIPVAATMSVIAGYQAPGPVFRIQSFNFKNCLFALVILTPVFIIAGYFWGLFVYKFRRQK